MTVSKRADWYTIRYGIKGLKSWVWST